VSAEDDLGWEYFGPDPMNSPRMMEHMDWHNDPQNRQRTGNYGERFLEFHRQFIDKFDAFRATKSLLQVEPWDPSTQIPGYLSHDYILMAARQTDYPFSINPHCKTPTWATAAGGTDPDPLFGHTSLLQFASLDQLGRSIDGGWHGTVHNTIGGDMSQFHSPIDPIFWRWHRWVDGVRSTWVALQPHRAHVQFASTIRVLFGIVNDAPGIAIGPNGVPNPVPGRPGDPERFVAAAQNRSVIRSLAVHAASHLVDDPELKARVIRLAEELRERR
jgi:hypothetical protein